MTTRTWTGLFLSLGLFCSMGAAQEVSYFRGDHGVSTDSKPLPVNFESDATLLWRTTLEKGNSTPCVCGNSIYVTVFQEDAKELATVAIDRESGRVRWKQTAPIQQLEAFHVTGSPASSTPACNGTHVFVFFGSYGLLCYDLNGNLVWERKMGPFQDEFGACSSPVLVDNLVLLNEDHDINSFLIAIDQSTGETVWTASREAATRSYSTPVVLERNGQKEILVAGALQLTAYDAATGTKKWWFNGLSRIVDSTPVIQDGIVYIATWTPGGDAGERIVMEPFAEASQKFDTNGDNMISKQELPKDSPVLDRFFRIDLNQNENLEEAEWKRHAEVFDLAQNVAIAIEPGTTGELTSRFVKWTYSRGLPTVPSSVVSQGVLTMVKDSGIVTMIDIENGRMLHQGRAMGRGNYYSSLVAGDDKVYLASESGVVTVLQGGKDWNILSSHDFGERMMATPVISDGKMFFRTDEAIYCFVKK